MPDAALPAAGRHPPPRVLALVLLRVLAILASFTWLAFSPPELERPRLVAALLTAFLAYGVGLFACLWRRPGTTLRWNVAVTAVDMAFALVLVVLTGGARSVFFLAFYLITALQAYYYGIGRGLVVAAAASALYLVAIWPTLEVPQWPDYALRGGMLLVTAVGLGVLGEVEERERRTVLALRAEAEARERYIEEVLESLRDGVVVLDRRRRITGWNRAMALRFGIASGEALGRPLLDVLPGLALAAPALERLLEEGRELLLSGIQHELGPGDALVLDVKGSATRSEAARAAVLLVEDVTERVALERAARQAEKLAAIGTLATGLAHEINNPVGIITTRLELLLEGTPGEELPVPVRADIEVLRRHVLRVSRITQELLAFARQGPGVREPVDLNAVVEETLLLVGTSIDDRIRVVTRLASGLPLVAGDANQLGQVVLNLVSNARDAIAGAGEIRIETGPDPLRDGWVRLAVSDTGPGIPEERQAKIFEPFFTTKPGGTGLGLSVSYGIVRAHGGELHVDSRVGAGARFTAVLPGARAGREGEGR